MRMRQKSRENPGRTVGTGHEVQAWSEQLSRSPDHMGSVGYLMQYKSSVDVDRGGGAKKMG
jgi:hypothetical protein